MERMPFENFPFVSAGGLEKIKEQTPPQEQLKTRIELRGEKQEIVYPGFPIDIYLGGKFLQIIDVRNDDRWNAEYVLIDPLAFDQANPTKGFKGIRDGEPFIVGRANPLRFDFPITVSRMHLKIELRNGKLILEDLQSTNGTIVELRGVPKVETVLEGEFSPEAKRVLAEFRDYIANHQAEIEKQLWQGRDLADIFYRDFYNSSDQIKYREDDPAVKEIVRRYEENIEQMAKSLHSQEGISVFAQPYWLWCMANGGYRQEAVRGNKLGRFYFNCKPEFVGAIFSQFVKEAKVAGLHIGTKIPRSTAANALNRMDKMVVYFESDEEEQALRVVEDLYYKNPSAFDETGTPRFTAALKDFEGKILQGVGFGEEPLWANESFGTVRAAVLARVYEDSKRSGFSLLDSKFDLAESFRKACIAAHVDPQNPAFNISSGGVPKFEKIRSRI